MNIPMSLTFRWPWLLLSVGLCAIVSSASAAINVFACEPEWGALVNEIAGRRANVFVATTAMQDPHRVQARPSFIARARNADLLICTGAELEIGYLPILMQQAGNDKIQV